MAINPTGCPLLENISHPININMEINMKITNYPTTFTQLTESMVRHNIEYTTASATYYWNMLNDTLRASKGPITDPGFYPAFVEWIKTNEKTISI